jgi:hypothetical protein
MNQEETHYIISMKKEELRLLKLGNEADKIMNQLNEVTKEKMYLTHQLDLAKAKNKAFDQLLDYCYDNMVDLSHVPPTVSWYINLYNKEIENKK